MIVKVQLSIVTNEEYQQVLVYSENQENWYQGDAGKPILKMMGGELKKFFYAMVPYEKGQITLLDEAPWQDW